MVKSVIKFSYTLRAALKLALFLIKICLSMFETLNFLYLLYTIIDTYNTKIKLLKNKIFAHKKTFFPNKQLKDTKTVILVSEAHHDVR